MAEKATGDFEVNLTPQPPSNDSGIGRMAIDKTFTGDLAGSSVGEMLAFRSAVEGSAGYVAIEKVTGKLHGREGTFLLHHKGTMDRGAQEQSITVIPDSGTGQLDGLSGSMRIIIEDGKHLYEFDYDLAV